MPTFESHVLPRLVKQGECLLWTGSKDKDGYGMVYCKGGARKKAHRLACAHKHGENRGASALHSCDTPACCSPDHLSWGGHRRNSCEARDRGTTGRQKLTRYQAWRIRYCEEGTSKEVALSYGLSPNTVRDIRRGTTWADLREDEYAGQRGLVTPSQDPSCRPEA